MATSMQSKVIGMNCGRLRGHAKQWRVAEMLEISQSQLSLLETGRAEISKHMLVKMAEIFKVSAWELMNPDNVPELPAEVRLVLARELGGAMLDERTEAAIEAEIEEDEEELRAIVGRGRSGAKLRR